MCAPRLLLAAFFLVMASTYVVASSSALNKRDLAVDGTANLILAQREAARGKPGTPKLGDSVKAGKGLGIFHDAVKFIKAYYVRPVSDEELFQKPISLLTMATLPGCTEGLDSEKQCTQPSEECFTQFIRELAERCGLDEDRLAMRALNFILRNLDVNSAVLDAGMLNELKISTVGKFGGVGMVVAPRDSDYVVISSFDGSPAQRAGIGAGDTVLEIDDRPLTGLPLMEALNLVRGPAGSSMAMVVKSRRTGKIREVRLRRKIIRIAPVRSLMLENGVGYVRIVNFQEHTAREAQKALYRLLSSHGETLTGLILDIRDNPGGLFEEGVKLAAVFRPGAVVTSLRGREPEVTREIVAGEGSSWPAIPMVVLINRGTASAAEILAGALQGLPNVLLAGERSFGKASVQAVFPLDNGMALRLTTAHYYTADGRNIDGIGIEPDASTESHEGMTLQKMGLLKPDELESDPEIRAAIDYLLEERTHPRSPFPTLF